MRIRLIGTFMTCMVVTTRGTFTKRVTDSDAGSDTLNVSSASSPTRVTSATSPSTDRARTPRTKGRSNAAPSKPGTNPS